MKPLLQKILLAVLTLATMGAQAKIAEQPAFEPSTGHLLATELVTGFISRYHYKKTQLDDALSAQILARYLEDLDPNRSYFLRADIEAFSKYETRLDDYLRAGRLEPAFEIFEVFKTRLNERVDHALDLLEGDFDFTVPESYVFDRSEKPWARNQAALDEIWRKRVKNDVLSLRLADQKTAEITKTLRARYERLRSSTAQFRPEDVHQLFVNAFTQTVEPHTAYLPPRASEDFEIRMSLSLEGIGAVLQSENEYTVIREIVTGGPADASDAVHVEDRIIGVGQGEDGKIVDVVGWRLDDVVDLIRGPKGTQVRLRVLPKGAASEATPKLITLTRKEVKLEDQAAQKSIIEFPTDDGQARIGVIKVPAFYMDYEAYAREDPNYRSTTRDVRRLLEELKAADVDGIVVDLRGNGGGSLTEATQLTGLFIESGPIVQVKDTTQRVEVLQDPDPSIAYAGPLAVLVDGASASASEIFAGAIQDYNRGIVIGQPTFGKGTVQKIIDLNQLVGEEPGELGQLTTTIAQFYRVSGASTQHRGVVPDIIFPSSSGAEDQGERALDNALPWDEIHAASFTAREARPVAIERARERHARRMQTSPAFDYLLAEIEASEEVEDQIAVSLVEKERRQELEAMETASLKRENRYRKTQDLPPRAEGKPMDEPGIFDPDRVLLTEAAHILYDLIDRPAPGPLQAAD
jgi:carboxyl-terminal processing protease